MTNDPVIVEVETVIGEIAVHRITDSDRYNVYCGGVLRHPWVTAEGAMRALGHYLQGLNSLAPKQERS